MATTTTAANSDGFSSFTARSNKLPATTGTRSSLSLSVRASVTRVSANVFRTVGMYERRSNLEKSKRKKDSARLSSRKRKKN